MVGLHKQFRDNQFMFIRLGEMRGGGFSNIDRQNTSLNELPIIEQALDENSAGVGNWAGFYGPILQLNLFIQKVEPLSFLTQETKDYLLAQAYAMRSYYYFHLLRTYGGVPLRTEPEVLSGLTDPVALRKERAPEEEVLQLVKSDVDKAVLLFGNAAVPADKSLWNPWAAKMLQGEVYLWSAKLYNKPEDLTIAKNALNSINGPVLLDDFSRVFAYNNKNNPEIILSTRFRVGEAEMSNVATFTYSTFNFDGQHYKDSLASGPLLVDPLNITATNSMQIIQRYGYTFELFESYDINDQRRNATFYDYYKVNTSVNPHVVTVKNTALVKFLGTIDANKRYFADDWVVYREAERLLMLAEIVNAENGDPSPYIKQIRDRAFGGPGNDPSPFVNGSKDENELAIFEERMKEFVYEGKQWYDLRRMKIGNEPLAFKSNQHPYGVLDKGTEAHKLLWPIPPSVWTNDPLVNQTPGYPTAKPQ